jgi:hypothetical protein
LTFAKGSSGQADRQVAEAGRFPEMLTSKSRKMPASRFFRKTNLEESCAQRRLTSDFNSLIPAGGVMRVLLAFAVLLSAAGNLLASGPVGIYGIVEKVIFEPNEKSPERIQVWGAFEFVENGLSRPGTTSMPKHGYLYFKLPSGDQQFASKTEWADLKSVAGTGQAIGFGNWGLVGNFNAIDSRPAGTGGFPYLLSLYPGGGAPTDVRVHPATESPSTPAVYSTNTGIVKLTESSHANIIKELREALKK